MQMTLATKSKTTLSTLMEFCLLTAQFNKQKSNQFTPFELM